MIIAINEENQRIHPFKNGKGKCECCNELVIAHCGEIRKYHWQHKSLKDCDSWKEPETEWHINWKNEFPMDNQEVIIEKNDQKHRADVKNDRGIVIEFQNSSIASSTIREREEFYGEMVWVINAEKFKDTFIISSSVKRKLEEREYDYDEEISYYYNSQSQKDSEFRESTLKLEDEIYQFSDLKHSLFTEINQMVSDKLSSSWLANIFYQSILENKFPKVKNGQMDFFFKIKNSFESQINQIDNELSKSIENISKNQNELNNIDNVENYILNEVSFKIISYEIIDYENFERVTIIKRDDPPLFINPIKFKNILDFETYKVKKENYFFLADFSKRMDYLTISISELSVRKSRLEEDIKQLKASIANNVLDLLDEKIISKQAELNSLPKKIKDKEAELIELNLENDRANHNSYEKQIQYEFKKDRIDIMNKFKGQYNLNWKHRRQSWDHSKKILFFDLGNEYLFERINSTTLKRHNKTDFIQKFS